jgi:23S rRNA (guanosine2251-2'-O)-methyltransferase
VKGGGEPIWIWGRHEVELALGAGLRKIHEVLVVEGRDEAVSEAVIRKARERGAPVRRLARTELEKITGPGHNGVAARVGPRSTIALAELLAAGTPGSRLVVLLDGVEDPRNFGAILRSAEAFGADGVVVTKDRSAPLSGAASKASAGLLETARIAEVPNLRAALDRLREAGFWLYGAAGEGRPCFDVKLTGDVALVLGGEGEGLRRLTRETVDELVSIPISPTVESLNVSVAAAILLFETRRQQGWKPAAAAPFPPREPS